jgi:hypothetical protein
MLWKINNTSSKLVFIALVFQHAMHMRLIILPYVDRSAVQYFSTLSHKGHEFRKKKVIAYMYVLVFSTTCVWNVCQSKKN